MFAENLRKYRNAKGLSQGALAEKVASLTNKKCDYEKIKSYENGINPPIEFIVAICEVLEIEPQFLFDDSQKALGRVVKAIQKSGNPDMIAMLPATTEALNNDNYAKILKYEIYAGGGQVGIWDEKLLTDSENFYVIDKRLLPINIQSSHLIMMQIVGDSMEPKYNEGDWVLIEHKNGRPVKYVNGVHIVKYGDTVQIKNVEFLGNGDIRCSSYNQAYAPFQPIKDFGEAWDIIGKVCGKLTIGTGFVWE